MSRKVKCQALTPNAALELLSHGPAVLPEAMSERPERMFGLNTIEGAVWHPGVAKGLNLPAGDPMAWLTGRVQRLQTAQAELITRKASNP